MTESFFNWLHSAFPGRAYSYVGFSPELAHLIEAAATSSSCPPTTSRAGSTRCTRRSTARCPSCARPAASTTRWTTTDEATGEGTGFKFWEPTDKALFYTLGWAVSTWFDRPQHYQAMQRRGMLRDFSWTSSAKQYEEVYEQAIAVRA